MAWHKGECPICKQEKLVGYVACLKLKLCSDCVWDWQNGKLIIKQVFGFSRN